jgi:hypothetical protein
MHLFHDRFMAVLVTNAEQAAAELDESARALQMATLAANILARLATSELLKSDTKQQAALLAVGLVVSLQLELWSLSSLAALPRAPA